jgi:hypothetical protein
VESGYLPVAVVTLHLASQTRCAEFQTVAALLHLVENFLGRLIGYLSTAYIAKDECRASEHLSLPRDAQNA